MDATDASASKDAGATGVSDAGVGPSAPAPPPHPMIKVDHYQTDADVVVSIFLKNQQQDNVHVDFSNESFRIAAKMPDGSDYTREFHLAKDINPEFCSFKIMSTKIDVRLRKQDGGPWPGLETELNKPVKPTYPSSSKKKFDWDKVEKEIEKQEKDDPDSDINSLFAKIYESGDENTRKAMIKSMQESGGTVLSTNWEEVGKKQVEISPPDGMEFKKWDG